MLSCRCGQHNMTIIIHQYRYPAGQEISHRFYMKTFQASMLQHFFLCNLRGNAVLRLRSDDLGGRMAMIHQGVIVGKSFC